MRTLSLADLISRNLKPAPRPAMLIGYCNPRGDDTELRDAGAVEVHAGPLADCLAVLQSGDTLVAAAPSNLARSPAALLALEAKMAARGVFLVILHMGGERLDTRKPDARFMLAALEGVAQWQRETQRAGIATAHASGRLAGRAATIDRGAVIAAAAAMGPAKAARALGIARSSVYRAAKAQRAEPAASLAHG